MEPSITSSRQLEFTIAFTSLCMAFQFGYLALLLRVMTKDGAIRKKAVNVMILTDEGIKLLASIGTLIGAILSSIWREMSQLEGSNFIGNSSICQLYITLSFCAFWSVIGSAGSLERDRNVKIGLTTSFFRNCCLQAFSFYKLVDTETLG